MSQLLLHASYGETFQQRNHTVCVKTAPHWNLTKFFLTTDKLKNTPQNVNPGRDLGKFWLRMNWLASISMGLTQTHGSSITPASRGFGFLSELHGSGPFLIVITYVVPCCSAWLLSGPSQLPFWPHTRLKNQDQESYAYWVWGLVKKIHTECQWGRGITHFPH